jgi:hypothetical protein
VVERGDAEAIAAIGRHDDARRDHAQERVSGEQEDIVRDDRSPQPDHDPVGVRRQLERPLQRVGGDDEGRDDRKQVNRARAIAIAERLAIS